MPARAGCPRIPNLVACIDLDENRELLGRFLSYYRGLGVRNFVVIVNSERNEPVRIAAFLDFLAQHAIEPMEVWCGAFDDRTSRNKLNAYRREHVAPEEWCFNVDVDEFVALDEATYSMLQTSAGNYIEGRLVDRLSVDGSFPAIERGRTLEETFPLRSFLSEQLLGAYTGKIPLSRGAVQIDIGHHWVCPQGQQVAPRPVSGHGGKAELVVNHFKWSDDVVAKLRKRLGTRVKETEVLWRQEMRRFLAAATSNVGPPALDLSRIETWAGVHHVS